MSTTPDRRPGPLIEDEEIRLIENASTPSQAGALNYDGANFVMRDSLGSFNPRSGGGISEAQHTNLDTLNHEINQTSYDEVTRVNGKVTRVSIWDSPLKSILIREDILTRSGIFGRVTQCVTNQYDRNTGALKETLTEVFARSGRSVISISRTRLP